MFQVLRTKKKHGYSFSFYITFLSRVGTYRIDVRGRVTTEKVSFFRFHELSLKIVEYGNIRVKDRN